MRTPSDASLPDLLDREVSDDEEDTVARGAAASTSRVRTFRKRVSSLTGQTGFFSGKKKEPGALLGGMPLAPDVCAGCGAPSDLSCSGCGSNYCAPCSTLTGDALARAAQREKKSSSSRPKKDAPTLYICDGCGGGLSSTRCPACLLRAGNDPLEATVVVRKLKGAGHHHASLNCEEGPTFQSKCPPCTNGRECVNCFDEDGDRIDDGRPRGDATTAGAARELKYKFGFNEGEVCIEKGSGRRATVIEDGGTGLEAKVVFQGSDVPEVVAPYLVFSHYVEDGVELELEWPDRRCRLCRLKKGVAERDAQHRQRRDAMDAERAATGVQGRVGVRLEDRRDWLTPNPSDPDRRCDRQKVEDAYADIEAASLPQDDDAVTGRQV